MKQKPYWKRGKNFKGPNGQGYILTRDAYSLDVIRADAFYAYGGAPQPGQGEQMPRWLVPLLKRRRI